MPKPTAEEFKIARIWLEAQLLKDPPTLKLPCKISRKKIKKGTYVQVGDIPTEHSFVAFPTEDGWFVLGALPRAEKLGTGMNATAKKVYWEPGANIPESKVSILLDRFYEAENISDVSTAVYGGKSELYKNPNNLFMRPSSQEYIFRSIFGGNEKITAKNKSYVLQSFIKGKTLGEFLRDTKINKEQVLNLAMACTLALQNFRESGYKHLDAHIENIIIYEEEVDGAIIFKAEMIDFGLSKKSCTHADDMNDCKDIARFGMNFDSIISNFVWYNKSDAYQEFIERFKALCLQMEHDPRSYNNLDLLKEKLIEMELDGLNLKSVKSKLGANKFQEILDATKSKSDQYTNQAEYTSLLLETLISAYAAKIGLDISEMRTEVLLRASPKLNVEFQKVLDKGSQTIDLVNKDISSIAAIGVPRPRVKS